MQNINKLILDAGGPFLYLLFYAVPIILGIIVISIIVVTVMLIRSAGRKKEAEKNKEKE